MRNALQPDGTIKRWTEIVVVVSLRSDAWRCSPIRTRISPVLSPIVDLPAPETRIQEPRSAPVRSRVESSAGSITYGLEDIAVVALDNLAQGVGRGVAMRSASP